MTTPTPIPLPTVPTPPPIAPGVIANVSARVLTVDNEAQTASVRVIDNNGGYLTPAVTLPFGVITPVQYSVQIGDVLESTDAKRNTGVVRWTDGLMWSESPTGIPARSTAGTRKIGSIAIPA